MMKVKMVTPAVCSILFIRCSLEANTLFLALGSSTTVYIVIAVIIILVAAAVAIYCIFFKGKKTKLPWGSDRSSKSKKSKRSNKRSEYRPETEQSILECKRAAVYS